MRVVLVSSFLCCVAACSDCEAPPLDAGVIDVPDGGVPRGVVAINELQPSNRTTIQDAAGGFGDWVELHNFGDADFDLSGWSLSDEPTELRRFVFPAGTMVGAGDFLLVWADADVDAVDDPELHAPFRLAAAGEELFLVDPDGVVADYASWGPIGADVALARVPDGDGPFSVRAPTPRERNAEAPPADGGFPPVVDAGCAPSARISEVMVDSATVWPDQFGSHEPWIEVVVEGDVAVRLGDLSLTDDPATPRAAPLPNELVQPGDVLVVWADGDVISAPHHVDLVVTAATQTLYLFDRCGQQVDALALPDDAGVDVSYGHGPAGGTIAYAAPTPDDPDNGPERDAGAGDADGG